MFEIHFIEPACANECRCLVRPCDEVSIVQGLRGCAHRLFDSSGKIQRRTSSAGSPCRSSSSAHGQVLHGLGSFTLVSRRASLTAREYTRSRLSFRCRRRLGESSISSTISSRAFWIETSQRGPSRSG